MKQGGEITRMRDGLRGTIVYVGTDVFQVQWHGDSAVDPLYYLREHVTTSAFSGALILTSQPVPVTDETAPLTLEECHVSPHYALGSMSAALDIIQERATGYTATSERATVDDLRRVLAEIAHRCERTNVLIRENNAREQAARLEATPALAPEPRPFTTSAE